MEQKIIELIAQYNHTDLAPLPSIEVVNYELKPLQVWKRELDEVVDSQVDKVCKEVHIDVFNNTLGRLTFLISFLEDFERESNAVVTKYSSYRKVMDKILEFDLSSKEDYEEWGRLYISRFGL